jgi:PPOX class probable F420-dependent enzyme
MVPVVFALEARSIFVPVDRLKPKRTTRLQRLSNLRADPRCALLVENYSDDWDDLWWVRVHGRGSECRAERLAGALSALERRHPRYRDPSSIATVIELEAETITGWAAR